MKDWQTFIESQPGVIETSNFICDASEIGLILVTGEDAESFLQNQFSNDLSQIDETRFQLSSYSTSKGRLLAIFQIVQISNGYLLITPISLIESLLQRLQMFVVQARVNLANASGHFARIALQSDNSNISRHPLLARQAGQVKPGDSVISLQLNPVNGESRYLVLCLSLDEAKALWDEFRLNLKVASFDAWRLSEIKAGMPVIYPQTSEEFVLQMSNLDLLDGVSFKKGCYPGQEIVARMHYLGKLKRRMFLTTLETDKCPVAGDQIITKGAESADGSGRVVDAVSDSDGLCHCLYVAQIKKAANNDLCLLDQPQLPMTPVELPYTSTTAEQASG
jgi:folate-binding protein YgfZ